ncbi:MAG TPA: hypothetical protein VMH48_08090 [Methylomirabilota bacterium]|nr:hypothetical protein [Methylomirabilota bacterium]
MDPRAVSEQLDKILQSQTFANKSQLRKLLEVLSQNMDSQATLKPAQVIKELWPAEIRTKRAADVATEMNRLRHALETYYEGEGKADPVAIYLPNRSVASGDGRSEKRWIWAVSRGDAEDRALLDRVSADRPTIPQVGPQKRLRMVAAAVALCAAVGVAVYFTIHLLTVPDQPRFGRLEGSALVIVDAEGKEVWRKVFPEGIGPAWYYANGVASRLWFGDLDGKGHTSVLFSYLPADESQPHSSTLICYSDRGKERWRWTPGIGLAELEGVLSTFKTSAIRVLKAAERRPPRIVVESNRDPSWGGPSQIAVLDSSGTTLSEYWHAGGLRDMVVADLDGDGKEEIIAAGVAHGYDSQATMVVMDADRMSGASKEVQQPEFQIHGKGMAQERLRLLFPRSDLNRASFRSNHAIEPTFQDGNLRLKVLECLAPIGCPLDYEFDKNFHLIAVSPSNDEFRSAHDRFYQKGRDAHTLGPEELAAFLKVRCLAGCKSEFVPVAQAYNPAATFESGWTAQRNPNGVWSYGYSSGFTNPITLYDKTVRNGINGPNAKYWLFSLVNLGTSPAAEYNDGPAYNDANIDFRANEFALVAGVGGQYSDLIFTAPVSSEYSIAGQFRGAQYGVDTVVGIVANGKVVFSSSVTSVGQLAPFGITLNLQAGNTVVFSVGPGSGAQNTALSVTITKTCSLTDRPVPTPTGTINCSGRPTAE